MRLVLNVVYVLLVDGLDGKERERFDNDLYAGGEGWDAVQARAMRRLDMIADQAEGE